MPRHLKRRRTVTLSVQGPEAVGNPYPPRNEPTLTPTNAELRLRAARRLAIAIRNARASSGGFVIRANWRVRTESGNVKALGVLEECLQHARRLRIECVGVLEVYDVRGLATNLHMHGFALVPAATPSQAADAMRQLARRVQGLDRCLFDDLRPGPLRAGRTDVFPGDLRWSFYCVKKSLGTDYSDMRHVLRTAGVTLAGARLIYSGRKPLPPPPPRRTRQRRTERRVARCTECSKSLARKKWHARTCSAACRQRRHRRRQRGLS